MINNSDVEYVFFTGDIVDKSFRLSSVFVVILAFDYNIFSIISTAFAMSSANIL